MREIKFRAWDGEEMNYEVSFLPQWGAIKKGYAGTAWSDVAKAGEIMQYTGLQDKNGKEIYEGDICRIGNVVAPIVWEEDSAYCGLIFDTEKMAVFPWELLEVIGNIHENPELLESP